MSKFKLKSWQDALSQVYALAAIDPVYRNLCLSDPRAAVRRVSDIELPRTFRFDFVNDSKDIFSSFLLPPLLGSIPPERREETEQEVLKLTEWCVEGLSGSIMMMHTIGGGTHTGEGTGTGTGTGTGSTGSPGSGSGAGGG